MIPRDHTKAEYWVAVRFWFHRRKGAVMAHADSLHQAQCVQQTLLSVLWVHFYGDAELCEAAKPSKVVARLLDNVDH